MNLNVIGRHTDVTEGMKEYGREKVDRLDRFSDFVLHGEMILTVAGTTNEAEMVLSTRLGKLVVKERAEGMRAAIDLLMDKMERLLTERKKKLRTVKRHSDRLEAMAILDEGMRRSQTGEEEGEQIEPSREPGEA